MTETETHFGDELHHVVIVGCGFGGLFAARALKRAPVRITVIDRTNHHLFQPLLYQVATGILSEGQIAPAIRDVLRNYPSLRVVLGEVEHIDIGTRQVHLDEFGKALTIAYDSLIVAGGASSSYFGHDEFRSSSYSMKSLDDALALRGQIFGAFELAEAERDPEARRRLMTFVVVGGGPTGVEMAGQLRELSGARSGATTARSTPSTPESSSWRVSTDSSGRWERTCPDSPHAISPGWAWRSTSGPW